MVCYPLIHLLHWFNSVRIRNFPCVYNDGKQQRQQHIDDIGLIDNINIDKSKTKMQFHCVHLLFANDYFCFCHFCFWTSFFLLLIYNNAAITGTSIIIDCVQSLDSSFISSFNCCLTFKQFDSTFYIGIFAVICGNYLKTMNQCTSSIFLVIIGQISFTHIKIWTKFMKKIVLFY